MSLRITSVAVALVVAGSAGAQEPATAPGPATAPADVYPFPPQHAAPVPPTLADLTVPNVPRLTVHGEYLLWWSKNGPASVPLLATAPPDSAQAFPGATGDPTATFLTASPNFDVQAGLRITAAWWFGAERVFGLEGSYLFLGKTTDQQSAFGAGGPDAPFVVNPFFDAAEGGAPRINFLAIPASDRGGGMIESTTRLQGGEANLLGNARRAGFPNLTLLTGFRYLYLGERVTLTTTQANLDGFFFPGQFVNTTDDFRTRNNFYGGQLGLRVGGRRGCFFLSATGKVGLGVMSQEVAIAGTTTTNSGPDFASEIPVTTVPGGIYAQPTNIGTYTRDRFAVVPEVTVQAGVSLTKCLRLFVGYNFLYLSSVARPGEQIDPVINSTQLASFTGVPTGPLVGPARPAPVFRSTDYWVQGVNFGLSYHW